MNLQLKRYGKGNYQNVNQSWNTFSKVGNVWQVARETDGEVLFEAATLRECKEWQSTENEILGL